jgi:hypothetical protein
MQPHNDSTRSRLFRDAEGEKDQDQDQEEAIFPADTLGRKKREPYNDYPFLAAFPPETPPFSRACYPINLVRSCESR